MARGRDLQAPASTNFYGPFLVPIPVLTATAKHNEFNDQIANGRWQPPVSAIDFGGRARWAIYLAGFLRRAARTRGRSFRSPRMTYST